MISAYMFHFLFLKLLITTSVLQYAHADKKDDSFLFHYMNPSSSILPKILTANTSDDLIHLQFSPSSTHSTCHRLLSTESQSVLLVFPNTIACAKVFSNEDHISIRQTVNAPVENVIVRNELHQHCNGRCIFQLQQNHPHIVLPSGLELVVKHDTIVYEKQTSTFNSMNDLNWVTIILLFSSFLVRKRLNTFKPRALFLLITISVCYYFLPQSIFDLEVAPGRAGTNVNIQGYTLFNFELTRIRKGSDNCAIYTCNAYKNVRNMRTNTKCDLLNVHGTRIEKDGRNVVMNWIKVLSAIWLIDSLNYETLIYIDRDLILYDDPSLKIEFSRITFSDLGGQRPDSAMFIVNTHGLRNNSNIMKSWLTQESGFTSRNDGGEEQEILLNMWEHEKFPTKPLYTFQCGRNSYNRAQCLMRSDPIPVNIRMIGTKLLVESIRAFLFSRFRSKIFTPSIILTLWNNPLSKAFPSSILYLFEFYVYKKVFDTPNLEVKCPSNSRKSITHGSFDNPYEQVLQMPSRGAIVVRNRLGLRCFSSKNYRSRWNIRSIDILSNFLLATMITTIIMKLSTFENLLNPAYDTLAITNGFRHTTKLDIKV